MLTDQSEAHKLAMIVGGLGVGSVDYLNDTITLDETAARAFDLEANVAMPRDTLHERIVLEDRIKIDHQVSRLLDPEFDNYIDVKHRVRHTDGSIRWISARKQVEFDYGGVDGAARPVSGLVAIMDISDLKHAEDHARSLLQELNHRSKNLLTVVMSLARQTLRNGDIDTFEDRFSARITGLGHNLDRLVKNEWRHVGIDDLADGQLAPFVDTTSERIRLDGPAARVKPDASQAIGMAFHELATNATKYGALSNDKGHISLTWGPEGENFVIRWQESGGPKVNVPKRNGFGHTVICTFAAAAVNGTAQLDYPPDGVVWTLTMPKTEIT